MSTHSCRLVLCVLAALIAAGCEGVIDPSKNRVEEFSGTLEPFGTRSHEFSVDKNGELDVKITHLTNPDAFLELAYGDRLNGCSGVSVIQFTQFAQLNRPGLGGFISGGQYCLYLSDNGSLTKPENYTLRVSHP